jgi:hypothetical protein
MVEPFRRVAAHPIEGRWIIGGGWRLVRRTPSIEWMKDHALIATISAGSPRAAPCSPGRAEWAFAYARRRRGRRKPELRTEARP